MNVNISGGKRTLGLWMNTNSLPLSYGNGDVNKHLLPVGRTVVRAKAGGSERKLVEHSRSYTGKQTFCWELMAKLHRHICVSASDFILNLTHHRANVCRTWISTYSLRVHSPHAFNKSKIVSFGQNLTFTLIAPQSLGVLQECFPIHYLASFNLRTNRSPFNRYLPFL